MSQALKIESCGSNSPVTITVNLGPYPPEQPPEPPPRGGDRSGRDRAKAAKQARKRQRRTR